MEESNLGVEIVLGDSEELEVQLPSELPSLVLEDLCLLSPSNSISSSTEYVQPLLFEDGMDTEECELYYAAHEPTDGSASPAHIRRRLGSHLRRSTRRWEMESQDSADPMSPQNALPSPCLKSAQESHWQTKQSDQTQETQEPTSLGFFRRCSFNGMSNLYTDSEEWHAEDENLNSPTLQRPSLQKSYSQDELKFFADTLHSPLGTSTHRCVGFQSMVHVLTIPMAEDYPEEIRANLWISRKEFSKSRRRRRQQRHAVVDGQNRIRCR